MLSREWRCSWSSADRRCSNYIWVIDNFIAHRGASYIRGFTVDTIRKMITNYWAMVHMVPSDLFCTVSSGQCVRVTCSYRLSHGFINNLNDLLLILHCNHKTHWHMQCKYTVDNLSSDSQKGIFTQDNIWILIWYMLVFNIFKWQKDLSLTHCGLVTVLEIPTGPPVQGRQLWRRTGNFFIFLQFYVYDLRFKAWGPTTFLTEFQTLPSDAIWQHRSGPTLAQVMACCLMAPNQYLNQRWLIISKV